MVTHCERGPIMINSAPIELVELEMPYFKAYKLILLLGRQHFADVEIRIDVKWKQSHIPDLCFSRLASIAFRASAQWSPLNHLLFSMDLPSRLLMIEPTRPEILWPITPDKIIGSSQPSPITLNSSKVLLGGALDGLEIATLVAALWISIAGQLNGQGWVWLRDSDRHYSGQFLKRKTYGTRKKKV